MIEFESIEVRFGDFVAISKLDLTIEEGEFFTLLGPSGCGKTTLLRTLAGFVHPTQGQIRIGAREVTTLPSDKRDIGMVFQNYALFPSLSVYDNIGFGLKVAKTAKDELDERVRAIACEVDLTQQQLDKGVAELSGGQQQRVAIARAMVLRPSIMLLDEPLSNLDAKLRHQMRTQLKELQNHFGVTSLYVTHDQDEALALSDRIAVLHQGRIEQVGRPEDIYQRSATEFVCNFVGDVNVLPRRLAGGSSGRPSDGLAPAPAGTSYVRIEKVRLLNPDEEAPEGHLTQTGTVTKKEYRGITYAYEVRFAEAALRAVVPEDGRATHFAVGDQVRIAIDPGHVLSYGASA